jgi:hypothetical protein
MKITKRQLRQIIKEEKSRLLNENLDQELYGKIDKAFAVILDLEKTVRHLQRPLQTVVVPHSDQSRIIDQAIADIKTLLLDAIDHTDKSS